MKTPNSALTAYALGEDKVIACVATIIITDKSNDLLGNSGLKKFMIGGAIITDVDLKLFDEHWGMMECEVIIIPNKQFAGWKKGAGQTLCGILTDGYARPESWKKEVK